MKVCEVGFRVYDKEAKEYNGDKEVLLSSDNKIYRIHTITGELQQLRDEFLEIEFWIGLKDKKGVKIYEGDIVRVKQRIIDLDCPEEVEPFIAIVKKYHDDSIPLYFMMYKTTNNNVFDFEYYEVEVIGNIHENPELLESLEN